MTPPLRRPAGVTAAAVVALIGSLLAFLFAVMIVTTAFMELSPAPPAGYAAAALAIGLFTAALAILGLATSIALLRMRAWARVAALALAVVLAIIGAFGLMVGALVPGALGGDVPADVAALVRPVTLAIFAIPTVVAAWWLVQFNRRATKEAFAAASPEAEPALPISIAITAWASIVGGAACVVPILLRMPVTLLGVTLTGWASGVVYAFFGALSIYIGRGLLDLRERARRLCLAWYVLSAAHTALVTLVPSLRERTIAAQQAFAAGQGSGAPADAAALLYLTLLLMVGIAALAIAFLHRHRALFHRGDG